MAALLAATIKLANNAEASFCLLLIGGCPAEVAVAALR